MILLPIDEAASPHPLMHDITNSTLAAYVDTSGLWPKVSFRRPMERLEGANLLNTRGGGVGATCRSLSFNTSTLL